MIALKLDEKKLPAELHVPASRFGSGKTIAVLLDWPLPTRINIPTADGGHIRLELEGPPRGHGVYR